MPFGQNLPLIEQIPLDIRVFIVRFVVAVAVFLVFWLLRHLISRVISKPIRRLVEKTDTRVDDVILQALQRVSGYLVLALAVFVVALILGAEGGVRTFFVNNAITLLVFALFRFLYDLATYLFQSPEKLNELLRTDIDERMIPMLRFATKVLIFVFGTLAIAQVWNVNIAGLVAGVGLAGLAISLAAKDLLDDLMGFGILIADNVYKPGEYVISPHGEGIIEKIGMRSTRIRQLNQGLVVAPNSKIANDSLVNWSRLEKRWFNFMVGVLYSSTAEQIEALVSRLRDHLKSREHVDGDSVMVYFTEYDDSSLNIMIRCYIDIEDWGEAKAERHKVNLEIMKIIDELDMSIAYPSRSLYLEKIPPMVQEPSSQDGHHKKDYGGIARDENAFPEGGDGAEHVPDDDEETINDEAFEEDK